MSATEGLSGNSGRNHTKGMAKGEENKNLSHPTQFLQLKSRRNTSNVQQHNENRSPQKKPIKISLLSKIRQQCSDDKKSSKDKSNLGPQRPKRQISRQPGRRTQQCLFERVVFFPEGSRSGWAVDVVVSVEIKHRRLVSDLLRALPP
jgi:hypothetical protein